ncbi:hypothetical protein GVO57_06350 [Sphingomonas changnyeongensis]|uniref:Uncharacterized protein n=1 Tax=Sphingomonas changnyeongensis TaxID=2698679 RepID=A0A7Z2NVK7_9SPHN|nr:hypothetical protein [Sphingomonas changnyeongensis]QHL90532.1 hypothetical protein GVO57_06350 [Sphingomonas changnyeongensis]
MTVSQMQATAAFRFVLTIHHVLQADSSVFSERLNPNKIDAALIYAESRFITTELISNTATVLFGSLVEIKPGRLRGSHWPAPHNPVCAVAVRADEAGREC